MEPIEIRAMGVVRGLFSLAAVCLFAFAGYRALLLAWADHQSRSTRVETVEHAAKLNPADADIQLRLATARESAGADPIPALSAAAALDSGNPSAWMRWGISAEMRGEFKTAETCLLQAARVSRQFEPRWTLANYYARRNDAAHFWPWVAAAFEMASGDLNPAFRLCGSMSPDPGIILARAIPRAARGVERIPQVSPAE